EIAGAGARSEVNGVRFRRHFHTPTVHRTARGISMTTLGKILVFVNLAFSVVTVSLICMVYATRTNWKVEYDKGVEELKAASGTIAALQKQIGDVETSKANEIQSLKTEIANSKTLLTAEQEKTGQQTKDISQREVTVKIAGVAVANATDAEQRLQ